jgi:hypothetical protein
MDREKYLIDRGGRTTVPRSERRIILILCEGEKTEPNYFKCFRYDAQKAFVSVKKSEYTNAKGIVTEAVERMRGGDYEAVWCVFDKDNNSPQDFNQAVQTAKDKGIGCAYSNECIELWFVQHFQHIESALPRHGGGSYEDILDRKLEELKKGKYEKNRKDMYDILFTKQTDAIRNAKNLIQGYLNRSPIPTLSQQNPVTTVHLLVEMLNNLPQ